MSDAPRACTCAKEAETTLDRVIRERDAAREECGYEKGIRRGLAGELSHFVRLKIDREAERDAARAAIERVRKLLLDHPEHVYHNPRAIRAALDGADPDE